jgi:hypothetical protein
LRWRTRKADAVSARALPIAVLDIEGGAGGDELLDYEREPLQRGHEERSAPAESIQLPG